MNTAFLIAVFGLFLVFVVGYAVGRLHGYVQQLEDMKQRMGEMQEELKRMRHTYSTADALDESRAHDLRAKFALRDQLIRLQADLALIDQELDHSIHIRDQIRNDPYGYKDNGGANQ